MFDEPPGRQDQPQGKLLLPGNEMDWQTSATSTKTQRAQIQQAQFMHSAPSSGPAQPHTKFFQLLRTDPAYQVLAISIALVLIASITFATLAGRMLSQLSSPQGNTTAQNAPVQSTSSPPGAASTNPSPTPATPTPSPTEVPTVTSQPTTTQQGQLSLQITNIPTLVNNNKTVQVTVAAGQPGVPVRLEVTYDASSNGYTSSPKTTGSDGTAQLNWRIRVTLHGGSTVTAHVTAVANDQNGQPVSSPPVTVQITNNN